MLYRGQRTNIDSECSHVGFFRGYFYNVVRVKLKYANYADQIKPTLDFSDLFYVDPNGITATCGLDPY